MEYSILIFRLPELFNVFMAAIIVVLMLRGDSRKSLFLLFVYSSLHFSFAAFPMLAGFSSEEIAIVHEQGSGLLAKLSAVAVLLVALFKLFQTKIVYEIKLLQWLIIAALLALILGFVLNYRPGDGLQLQNVFAVSYILLCFLLLSNNPRGFWVPERTEVYVILALLILMSVIGFYELFTLRSWAVFNNSYGQLVSRPSALLFNPNLLALWCAMLVLGFTYLYYKNSSVKLVMPAFVIACFGVYLSGSRGVAAPLLVILMMVGIGLSNQSIWRRMLPAVALLTVFSVMIFSAKCFSTVSAEHQGNWQAVAIVGERFEAFPIQLADYFLQKLVSLGLIDMQPLLIPVEFVDSVEGRFTGGLRDSGWLVIYDDSGWLGVIGVTLLWAYFGILGLSSYLKTRSVGATLALACWLMSILVGLLMRLQVFPTGIFVMLLIAPCITYWQLATVDKKMSPSSAEVMASSTSA